MRLIICWCVMAVLLFLGFREAEAIGRFSYISLRYATPISGQTAFVARQYAISNGEDNIFWPTFWREDMAKLNDLYVNMLSFSGDATLVWPAYYIAGTAPGVVDGHGIAVSETLAHRFWGSIDIIGMPVYVDGSPRVVRGIFKGRAELALLPFHIEDITQSWTGVELAGATRHASRSSVVSFAQAAGLGMPDTIITSGVHVLASFMALFPVGLLAVFGVVMLIKHMRVYYSWLLLGALVVFALCLPFLLDLLPPQFIPNRWSDFSFWSALAGQAGESMREFLGVKPTLRDVEIRVHLVRQTGVLIAGVMLCAGGVIMFKG